MTDILMHERELRAEFGITRVGDVTRLRRYGFPVFIATVPRSLDDLSVYAGAGATSRDARRRALAEVIERQTAADYAPPTAPAMASELRQILDIDALTFVGSDEDVIPCVIGERLDRPGSIPLPVELVACPYRNKRQFAMVSTNGLACGVNVEDATERALLELAERHVESLLFLRSTYAPRMRNRAISAAEADAVARELTWPACDEELDDLRERLRFAGDALRVWFHREPEFPPFAYALVTTAAGECMAGTASRWSVSDAANAAAREAVQGLLVDSAATREDVGSGDEAQHRHVAIRRSAPNIAWFGGLNAVPTTIATEAAVSRGRRRRVPTSAGAVVAGSAASRAARVGRARDIRAGGNVRSRRAAPSNRIGDSHGGI